MSESFSLARARCKVLSDPALREEIQAHTASDKATSGILRSIDRFGGDKSILRYEMTPTASSRISRATADAIGWTVRAVRPDDRPPVVPEASVVPEISA